MTTEGVKRKVSAIRRADFADCSRPMAADEAATVQTMGSYRGTVPSPSEQHNGRTITSDLAYDLSHLNLPILSYESGREGEAKAETTELLKLVPNFSVDIDGDWIPFKDPEQARRDMAALREAGLTLEDTP